MKQDTTIADYLGKQIYFEKHAAGYHPIPDLHPSIVQYIYRYGRIPKRRIKLHHIYTLELTAE